MKINDINFPQSEYYAKAQKKTQIVLHHTVSNPFSSEGDTQYWLSDPTRIATYAIIGYDGTVNRCFPSNMWAHHLGIRMNTLKTMGFKDYVVRNEILNRNSIAIEIDAWGALTKKGGIYYNAYNRPIDKTLEVEECDWRGFKYYQKYSDAQINTVKELLQIFMERYNIPKYGITDGDFDFRRDALAGVPGIYSHSNYRQDKTDLYPDKRLIEMLSEL